ncbi:MAG: hypoxanthine phosphoribosyltransferase [Actinomycetota bacterium]|nr:hypoxanthine phosphoribosyltransferase [Actinomycetota bacterium]
MSRPPQSWVRSVPPVVIDDQELRAGVRRLAGELSAAYPDGMLMVAVLKGSVPFLADLVRMLTVSPEIDFLAVSAYAPDTGRVKIVKDLDVDVYGRDVVLVEDIVDTGLTLNYVLGEIRRRQPRSLETCTLLDKRARRIVPTPIRFVGFVIPDEFVLGYGLDFAERYRNLTRVVAGDLTALREDPGAHVEALYSG